MGDNETPHFLGELIDALLDNVPDASVRQAIYSHVLPTYLENDWTPLDYMEYAEQDAAYLKALTLIDEDFADAYHRRHDDDGVNYNDYDDDDGSVPFDRDEIDI